MTWGIWKCSIYSWKPAIRDRNITTSYYVGIAEYDYASATSIALVMLMIAFVILFINAILQSRTSKIVSGRKIR